MDTETIFDHFSETYQLQDGSYVNCEILDTGGQEKYNAVNRTYYKRRITKFTDARRNTKKCT